MNRPRRDIGTVLLIRAIFIFGALSGLTAIITSTSVSGTVTGFLLLIGFVVCLMSNLYER